MRVLLTGATGFIGGHLANALAARGHLVVPLSRRQGVDFRDMTQPDRWLPYLRGIDAVINAVGIIGEQGGQRFATLHAQAPMALFRACARVGIRRILQISALGTEASAFSAYHLSKLQADDALRALDTDWFVLRPSLIYGRGSKSADLFLRLARLPLIPVIDDGSQEIQPIHIDDVVATALRCLTSPHPRQTLDIVGTEAFTFARWLQRMRQAQGLAPAPLLRVPYPLALALSQATRFFSPLLQPDKLHMLRTGYRADAAPLIRFLGRPPRPVEDALFFSGPRLEGGRAMTVS